MGSFGYINRLMKFGYDYSTALETYYRHCEMQALPELEAYLHELEKEDADL